MNKGILFLALLLVGGAQAGEIWPLIPEDGADAPALFDQLAAKGTVQARVHAGQLFDYCARQQAGTPVVDAKLQHCDRLLARHAEMRALWDALGKQAEQGQAEAVLAYTELSPAVFAGVEAIRQSDWVSQWKQKAMRLLRQLAEQGHPQAMLEMAKHYRMGVLVKPDPVQSAGWALAFKEKMRAPDTPQFQAFLAELSPEQKARAEQLARQHLQR